MTQAPPALRWIATIFALTEKQLGVVEELTEIVAAAAGDPSLRERGWVLSARAALAGDDVAGRMSTGVASATRSSRARRPTVSTGGVA